LKNVAHRIAIRAVVGIQGCVVFKRPVCRKKKEKRVNDAEPGSTGKPRLSRSEDIGPHPVARQLCYIRCAARRRVLGVIQFYTQVVVVQDGLQQVPDVFRSAGDLADLEGMS